MLTVISFATKNGDYPGHAERLRAECDALGVPHRIKVVKGEADWLANTRMKPRYIQLAVLGLRMPVLWLDVDSSLLSAPLLSDAEAGMDFMGRAKPEGDARPWHVDVMYFNATPAAEQLLRLWIANLSDHSDEHAFNKAWASREWEGAWATLPSGYSDGTIVRYRRSQSLSNAAALAALKGRYAPL